MYRPTHRHKTYKRFQISVNENVTVASWSGDQISSVRDGNPSIADIHHRNWRRDAGLLYDWRRPVAFKFPPNNPMNDFFQSSGCSLAFRRFMRHLFKRDSSSHLRCTKDDDQVRGESILNCLTLPYDLCSSVCLSVCLFLFLLMSSWIDWLYRAF